MYIKSNQTKNKNGVGFNYCYNKLMYYQSKSHIRKLKYCKSTIVAVNINDVKRKSLEQGLITKKCIAMHTNYILSLNWLYIPVPY